MKKFLLLLLLFPLFSNAQVIVTVAGNGTAGFAGDGGSATAAELNHQYGVAVDGKGNLYICDEVNRRVRKVHPAYGGAITTIAGNGTSGYSGDGLAGMYEEINGVIDVAADQYGNVYIPDVENNRIRKVDTTGIITTIAGTGAVGYNGENIAATAAQLNSPIGITVDSIGNVYFTDEYNYRIRKIDTAGIITTIAGIGVTGFSPDGSRADTARINPLGNIKIDKAGNIFFVDSFRIRKIDTAGILTTIAGNGIIGYSGDNEMATAAEIEPDAFALDTVGNLFIADGSSNRVREVNVAGIINTIAGTGMAGYSGDGGNPQYAEFSFPDGIVVSNSGDIYVSDGINNCIRLITKHPMGVGDVPDIKQRISVFPNPSDGSFTLMISSGINEQVLVTITNVAGEMVKEFPAATNQQVKVAANLPAGTYYISVATTQNTFSQKIVIQ